MGLNSGFKGLMNIRKEISSFAIKKKKEDKIKN